MTEPTNWPLSIAVAVVGLALIFGRSLLKTVPPAALYGDGERPEGTE